MEDISLSANGQRTTQT